MAAMKQQQARLLACKLGKIKPRLTSFVPLCLWSPGQKLGHMDRHHVNLEAAQEGLAEEKPGSYCRSPYTGGGRECWLQNDRCTKWVMCLVKESWTPLQTREETLTSAGGKEGRATTCHNKWARTKFALEPTENVLQHKDANYTRGKGRHLPLRSRTLQNRDYRQKNTDGVASRSQGRNAQQGAGWDEKCCKKGTKWNTPKIQNIRAF